MFRTPTIFSKFRYSALSGADIEVKIFCRTFWNIRDTSKYFVETSIL